MLIDMDFSGALFSFFLFLFPLQCRGNKNTKRKNVMIFLILLCFFSMHSFMSFTKWLFLGEVASHRRGFFLRISVGSFSVFTVFFALGVGVWKFALNMCILGFSFSHFLF